MTPSPNVENLKKQAKGLHKKLLAGDADSAARVRSGLPRLSGTPEAEVAQAGVTLQEVQHVIAVETGFSNWKQMLSEAGVQSPRKPVTTAYLHVRLPNLQREAEWFLGMLQSGSLEGLGTKGEWQQGWCMDRIRHGLPRVAGLSNEGVAKAGVTLAEVQQVVAADNGFVDWASLEAELGELHLVQSFEDLAGLEDEEIRMLIFRLGRDRLSVALKGASDHLMARIRKNTSPDAWQALIEAIEAHGLLSLSTVEAERARILEKYRSDDPLV